MQQTLKVDDLVRRAVNICRTELDLAEHELYVSIMPHVYTTGDAQDLAWKLAQLIQHAAAALPVAPIHILTRIDSREVEIVVRDNPVLIVPEQTREAFKQRLRPPATDVDATAYATAAADINATAALPAALARDHSVSMRVASDLIGHELVLRLPTTAPPALASRLTEPFARPIVRRRRILVVDDNCDVANTMATALQISGYETETAHDGSLALAALERFRPTVVLLDLDLPRMSGLQVATSIRALDDRQPLLIALTGHGSHEDKERTRAAGFAMHFTKPADLRAIIDFIEQHFALQHIGQAAESS